MNASGPWGIGGKIEDADEQRAEARRRWEEWKR